MRPVFCFSCDSSQFMYESSINLPSLQLIHWNKPLWTPLTPYFLLLMIESAKYTEIFWHTLELDSSFFLRISLIFLMNLILMTSWEIDVTCWCFWSNLWFLESWWDDEYSCIGGIWINLYLASRELARFNFFSFFGFVIAWLTLTSSRLGLLLHVLNSSCFLSRQLLIY